MDQGDQNGPSGQKIEIDRVDQMDPTKNLIEWTEWSKLLY